MKIKYQLNIKSSIYGSDMIKFFNELFMNVFDINTINLSKRNTNGTIYADIYISIKQLDDLKNVDAWIKHIEKISKVNELIINTGD